MVTIAGGFGLTWLSFRAGSPSPEGPPNSGIVVRTEVTALWIPDALRNVAQGEAGATIFHSPEALQTELERRGLNDAWYALTYRGYQVNGDSAESTQVRRISEAPAHIEEFQYMMATAAGNPPRHEGREFSQVKVGIIPDTLLTANPLNAVSQLVPERASSQTNGRATNWATAARTEPTVARSWKSVSYRIFVRRVGLDGIPFLAAIV